MVALARAGLNIASGSYVTNGPEKSYDKEQSLGKTELQFSKAAAGNSKAEEERGKKAAQTGKKHREARRGPGSAPTSGRG
jgi:hypothetical protein